MVSTFGGIISPVLIGRESELRTLVEALHGTQQGQGRCVLVSGEAGIGKSRLVTELRTRAAARQFVIWQGHCFEQDAAFPYAPWVDAFRAFLAPKSPEETSALLGTLASELIKVLPELSLLLPDLRPNPPLDAASEKAPPVRDGRTARSAARKGPSAPCGARRPALER
jgi:predicted ATPase